MNLDKYFFNKYASIVLPNNIFISYSGGVDSSVLLYLVFKNFNNNYKKKAIHIDHSINENSKKWYFFCKNYCKYMNIPIDIIKISKKNNFSLKEKYLRKERYRIFISRLLNNSVLMVAHNKDDFIETFLLRLFRGSGLLGLTSIKDIVYFGNLKIIRPLLNISKKDIYNYANKNNIRHIFDYSNLNEYIFRNYLRLNVIPLIEKKWPSFKKSICKYIKICNYNIIYLNESINYFKHILENKNFLTLKNIIILPYLVRCEILRIWIKGFIFKTISYNNIMLINKVIFSEKNKINFLKIGNYFLSKKNEKILLYKLIEKNKILINFKNSKLFNNVKFKYDYKNLILIKSKGINCLNLNYIYKKNDLKKIFQKYDISIWKRNNYPCVFIDGKLIMIIGLWLSKNFCKESKNSLLFIIK